MTDRVAERRRAAQLARHYREQEGLTIAEIARRLGRAEGTVKAYLYDWARERVREAMRTWRARDDAPPSSYDWSRTHAHRRGGEALKRVQTGEWPAPSTVIDLYGSWAAAATDAFGGA
jgi:predicted transcriptional regulator